MRISKSLLQKRDDKLQLLALLIEQDRRACEESLIHFVGAAWDVLEPGRKFVSNWHIESICEHLEAVERGEIRKLIINIPPGTCKSSLVGVLWPVWLWIRDPRKKMMSIAHNETLPIRDARKARKILESDWFHARWRDKITFSRDQNQKTKYENTQGGYRQVFGMTSGITGAKADIIIIDDPQNAKKGMYSETERRTVLDTFDMEISNRGIDGTSAIVLIMQRLHENDLSGYLLKKGDWEHLMFPMEFEPTRRCATSLGIQDIRTKENELLWPEYYNSEQVAEKKSFLRPVGVAGQLQQRPTPAEGGIVDEKWFQRYKTLPAEHLTLEIIQSLDTAQKANQITNAPSVIGTWLRTESGYYLIDVVRKWLTQPQLERELNDQYQKYRPHRVVIEDKSSGSGLIQYAQEETTIPVHAFQPEGDKITRMSVESSTIEAGNVFVPESAPWVADYLDEMHNFPFGTYKDQVDMTSQALKYFRTRSRGPGLVEID